MLYATGSARATPKSEAKANNGDCRNKKVLFILSSQRTASRRLSCASLSNVIVASNRRASDLFTFNPLHLPCFFPRSFPLLPSPSQFFQVSARAQELAGHSPLPFNKPRRFNKFHSYSFFQPLYHLHQPFLEARILALEESFIPLVLVLLQVIDFRNFNLLRNGKLDLARVCSLRLPHSHNL